MIREEKFNRRDFLKLSTLVSSSLFMPGCKRRENEKVVGIEDELNGSGIILENNWVYPIGFNSVRFLNIMEDFALLQTVTNKPALVHLSNGTKAYETPYEIQSHKITLSADDGLDRIDISCGRYVEAVRNITGNDPQTKRDELFLSTALSESIFNGIADLSVERGEITAAEGNVIADSYLDKLFSLPVEDTSLTFTRVYIGAKNKENQT